MSAQPIYNLIKELLTNHPALRNSDKKLIWSVWIKLGQVHNNGILLQDFLDSPSTETIRRCRQKIQEQYPELQATKRIKELRQAKEETKGTFIFKEQISLV